MLSVFIFAAFPPRTSPPCFNMNERLPRLGLKPTGSFHSREKFRLKFRMSALPGCTWTSSCMRMGCRGLLVHDGVWLKGDTYQAAPTSQVSWGEVLVTACALLKWLPDLAVQGESLFSVSTPLWGTSLSFPAYLLTPKGKKCGPGPPPPCKHPQAVGRYNSGC